MTPEQEFLKDLTASADEITGALEKALSRKEAITRLNIREARSAETLKIQGADGGAIWIYYSMPLINPPVTSDDGDDLIGHLFWHKRTFEIICHELECSLEAHLDRPFSWISYDLHTEKTRWKYVYHCHYNGESHVWMKLHTDMDDEFFDEMKEELCGHCYLNYKTDVDVIGCDGNLLDCNMRVYDLKY